MISFNPTYTLSVEVGPFGPKDKNGYQDATQNITFKLPTTCDFEINRAFWASAQTGTFTLYNLKDQTRNLLYHDRYNTFQRANIQFRAGYGGKEYLLFNGWVRNCYSKRPGKDYMTVIEAFDGAFQRTNSWTSFTRTAGMGLPDVIFNLNQDFVNTYKLAPTPFIGTLPPVKNLRAASYFGPTDSILRSILPKSLLYTIDSNRLIVMSYSDTTEGTLGVIDSANGLLEPPTRSETFVETKLLFNPALTMGQNVILDSADNSIFNKIYKVMGLIHSGTISTAVGGKRTTTASLYLGQQILQATK